MKQIQSGVSKRTSKKQLVQSYVALSQLVIAKVAKWLSKKVSSGELYHKVETKFFDEKSDYNIDIFFSLYKKGKIANHPHLDRLHKKYLHRSALPVNSVTDTFNLITIPLAGTLDVPIEVMTISYAPAGLYNNSMFRTVGAAENISTEPITADVKQSATHSTKRK